MKKLSVGAWITCIALLVAVIAFIVYSGNIGGEGYYKDASVNNLSLMAWSAILALAAAVALSLAKKDGKVAEIVSGVLRIGAAVLLAIALMSLIAGRVDGLGYIYFSNADVAKEVQTEANLASAQGAIWSMILFGAATLFTVISAFFSLQKKDA